MPLDSFCLRASSALQPAGGLVQMELGRARASFRGALVGDGLAFVHYKASSPEPTTVQVFDDAGDVHLSFLMRGGVMAHVDGQPKTRGWASTPSTLTLSHTPRRQIAMSYQGTCTGLRLLASRETLASIDARWEEKFGRGFDNGALVLGWAGIAPLHTLSSTLAASMEHDPLGLWAHPLWRQGKACEFLALAAAQVVMEGGPLGGHMHPHVQLRLRRARDLLLADLSEAPSLRRLAQECGMGLTNFKRDFKRLFGESAFALFQYHRMAEARRLIEAQGCSVSEAALAVGYTNFSQFAAAFRMAHGLPPSKLSRSLSSACR